MTAVIFITTTFQLRILFLLIGMSCLFLSPQYREVDESCSLLIGGQTA